MVIARLGGTRIPLSPAPIRVPRDFLRSEDRGWLLWLGIGFLAGYLVAKST